MNENQMTLIAHAQNLKEWMAMRDVAKEYPQFSYATLKQLFWKRAERPGLERCSRLVGKKLYINVPLFGLYLAGALPEQEKDATDFTTPGKPGR